MTFRQFAFNNVMRSKRSYSAFFFSSVLSVMLFFMYAMFIYHPDIENGRIHASAAKAMMAAEYIIYLFSFFFLFYAVSAFLKKRQKTFAILFIHGMSRGQRNKLIIWENMIIGFFAILCGIALGMVLAKLFFLFAAFLLETESLPFYLPWRAMLLTAAAFAVLFFLITLLTLLTLGKQQPIELLKRDKQPKKEPKASLLLSLLAAVLIGSGYTAAILAEGVMVPILLIPVSSVVIVGTYFLFSQLSVFTIRALKRNRRLYWRNTNLITLSDLAYRMKDNARMFFLVSIVSTVAFCAVGSFASYASSIRETVLATEPFAFMYTAKLGQPLVEENQQRIEQTLRKHGLSFTAQTLTIKVRAQEAGDKETGWVKLADYNRLAQAAGHKPVTLGAEQAIELGLLYYPRESQAGKMISLNGQTLQVEGWAYNLTSQMYVAEEVYLVSDEVYEQITPTSEFASFAYVVDNWEESLAAAEEMNDIISSAGLEEDHFTARVFPYSSMRQAANTMLFVGLFVGILFFATSGSFLYFRLYTDLERDKQQYRAIAKIGLSERELAKIVTTQVALLFFLPIAVAMIHSAVAFVSLQHLLALLFVTSIVKPTAYVLGCFLLVQIVYFLLIRSRYLHHLKEAIR